MGENFRFSAEQNNPTQPPVEAGAESRAERRLKDMALAEIKKKFTEEKLEKLTFVSYQESDDGSGKEMVFIKPGTPYEVEVLYTVLISPSGELTASSFSPSKASFKKVLEGNKGGRKGW